MNTPISQIVALTCHGNAFLSGHEIGAFFPLNSTFKFCDQVHFVVVEKNLLGKTAEKEIAKTPDEWFSFLKASTARGLRLSHRPGNKPPFSDRMLAGLVGGGGTWAMQVLLPKNRSEHYVARWEVWDQNAPANRIWRVTYGRVSTRATRKIAPSDLTDVAARLTKSLREIYAFSDKHELGSFTRLFADAIDTLDSKGMNLHGYHKDLAPAGFLSAEATAVLDTCQSAWVFGGMGSWNDLGFKADDQKEYERVSEQLFQTVNAAIVAAANSR